MTIAPGPLKCLTRSPTIWTGIRKMERRAATAGNWILFFRKIKASKPMLSANVQSLGCSLIRRCPKANYLVAFAGLCLAGPGLPNALLAADPLPHETGAIGPIGRNIVLERTDTDEVF